MEGYWTGFSTKAIHVGNEPDPETKAVTVPVVMSSTFVVASPTQKYSYGRCGNPTRAALEQNLAALEGAKHCVCTTSGMSACCLVMHLFKTGEHVIVCQDVYGGVRKYMEDMATNCEGLNIDFADLSSPENLTKLVKPNTRAVWVETVTNPLLRVNDIVALAKICHDKHILLIVDNTFLSPYLQNPLSLGASIVVHSCTAYIGGHDDILMGAIMTSDSTIYSQLMRNSILLGHCPGPLDCYLVLRGVKTLSVRMDEAQSNAQTLATVLAKHPKVEQCVYPGLDTHPGHSTLKKEARGFGAVIALKVKGGAEAAKKFCSALSLFTHAVSVGGVESLVTIPALTTHKDMTAETRKALGIGENLVRLSIGLEDEEDLKADLLHALDQI